MRVGGWILLTAAAAAALVALATDPYPGVTVDSAEYLAVARSLGEGRGLTMPFISYDEAFRVLAPGERVDMTQFPPLYPTVLALVHTVTGLSLLDAVRVTGAALFAGLIASVMTMVRARTGSVLAALTVGALLLAPDLLTVHAMAWSETIMIVAVVLALHFAAAHLRDREPRSLILAGVCGAVASMARFAGVAVLVTIAATLLFDRQRGTSTRRLRDATVFLALTLVPTAGWFLRNMLVAGYASEKRLGWHPPGADHLLQAVQAIGSWLMPGKGARILPSSEMFWSRNVFVANMNAR